MTSCNELKNLSKLADRQLKYLSPNISRIECNTARKSVKADNLVKTLIPSNRIKLNHYCQSILNELKL